MATEFSYSTTLWFEERFDAAEFQKWIKVKWTLSCWYAAAYVCLVFGGRRYMADRPKFDLRFPLAIWSGVLAVFSVMGTARTLPELLFMIRSLGWESSLCDPSCYRGPTSFWNFMFIMSKVYELGDTAFIVLRKQPLLLLHWYHHVSVLIYSWYCVSDQTALGRWFMVMNYAVHSVMYSYYCLKALRFRMPRWVSMAITAMQLMQMVVGITVNAWVWVIKARGDQCHQSDDSSRAALLMYGSYFVLFAFFFHNAYIKGKKTAPAQNGVAVTTNGTTKSANGTTNGTNGVMKKTN